MGEAVCDEDDVDEIVIQHVFEAVAQSGRMTGHAYVADFALLLGLVREALPFFAGDPRDIVDGVIHIEIDVVGLERAEAALKNAHLMICVVLGSGPELGGDRGFVALPAEGIADHFFGAAFVVALGRIKVCDALVERVTNEVLFVFVLKREGPEADVGDLEAGFAEDDATLNSGARRLTGSRYLGRVLNELRGGGREARGFRFPVAASCCEGDARDAGGKPA